MYPVSVRLASHLNALVQGGLSPEVAAHAITDSDVAHHIADGADRLDLQPLTAHPLEDALPALRAAEQDGWLLALPVPGAPGSLRGPRDLNEAALRAGEAVVGSTGGLALVPHRVGPAVQWQVFVAEHPSAAPSPYEAERELNEIILDAGKALDELGVAAGSRPRREHQVHLAPGYTSRQGATAERAARLLQVCDAAFEDDGAAISSFEIDRRWQILRRLRAAASTALCAAVSSPPQPQASAG